MERSTDLIARFDRDLRHVYVNPAAAAAGALAPEAYIGLTIAESGVPEPNASVWEARLRRVIEIGEPVDVVDTFDVAGEPHWFHTRLTPETGPDGAVSTILSVARDVTDRYRAEQAARAGEARYRGLFAGIPLGMTTARVHRDAAGRVDDWTYEDVNDAYLRITGFHDVVGHRLTDLLPQVREKDPRLLEFYDRVVTSGLPDSYEMRIASMDQWFAVTAFRSAPETFTAVVADVTARNRAQEALRRSEAELREAQRLALVGSWSWDVESDRSTWSDEMFALFALPPATDPPTGAARDALYTADSLARIRDVVARTVATGEPYEIAVDMIRADGTIRRGIAGGEPIRGADGRVAGIRGMLQDITDRVLAEAVARDRAERDMLLVEESADAIFRIDRSTGRITDANHAAWELFGRERDSFVDTLTADHFAADAVREWHAIRPTVEGGSTQAVECSAIRGDGRTITISARVRLLPDGSLLVDARDLTHERLVAQQLEHAQRMEAVGRLAGGIAHDFNNVLTVVDGYAALLQEELAAEDPRQAEVAGIREADQRAAALARQLLVFSRRQERQTAVLAVDPALAAIERMLCRLVGEDVRVRFEAGAPEAHVLADPGQLEQVIVNLAVNARDAMPRGGHLTLRTSVVEVAEADPRSPGPVVPGRYARVEVADTGSGIDPEALTHVFEPFFTTKLEGQGTGLGLSIVEGIVTQSGGFVGVESTPGIGTTFLIHLPLVQATGEAVVTGDPETAVPVGTEWVLVVEDDRAVLEIARRSLTALGYSVRTATEPRAALEIAADPSARIDAVVTDIVMPEMDGRTLARRLRTLRPGLPVVLMSASPRIRAQVVTRLAEAEFLAKPFTRSSLGVAVREAIDHPRGRGAKGRRPRPSS